MRIFTGHAEKALNFKMFPTLKPPILPHQYLQPSLFPFNAYRVIAVGDIHGCLDELVALLNVCEFPLPDNITPPVVLPRSHSEGQNSADILEYEIAPFDYDRSWLDFDSFEPTNESKKRKLDTSDSPHISDYAMYSTTILIILGDLVNKGPYSAEVVQFLRRLEIYCETKNLCNEKEKFHVFCLRGNHDEAAIKWATTTDTSSIPEKYEYVRQWSRLSLFQN